MAGIGFISLVAQTVAPETALAQLGEVVILAVVILVVVRAITPLIAGLVTATREGAEARKAVIERWEKSDHVVEKNTDVLNDVVASLRVVGDELKHLKDIDVQHVAQGAAAVNEIAALRADIAKGTEAAVNKVNQHMDEKTTPIEQRLETIERDVREVLAILRAREGASSPTEIRLEGDLTIHPPDDEATRDTPVVEAGGKDDDNA